MDKVLMPKVLVGVVTCDYKRYCEREFIDQICSFDYPSYDVMIVDNSFKERTKEIADAAPVRLSGEFLVDYDPWCEEPKHRLMTSYNKLREHALKFKYDYLLTIESDVFPLDKSFLRRWVGLDKPAIVGVYPLYFIVDRLSDKQKERLPKDSAGRKFVLSNWYRRSHFEGGRFYSRYWGVDDLKKGIVQFDALTGGFSMGLLLLNTDVLRRIVFKTGHTTPDAFVKQDLDFRKIPSYCDTDLIIRHEARNWAEFNVEEDKKLETLRYHDKSIQRVWEDENEKEKESLISELKYNQ